MQEGYRLNQRKLRRFPSSGFCSLCKNKGVTLLLVMKESLERPRV